MPLTLARLRLTGQATKTNRTMYLATHIVCKVNTHSGNMPSGAVSKLGRRDPSSNMKAWYACVG